MSSPTDHIFKLLLLISFVYINFASSETYEKKPSVGLLSNLGQTIENSVGAYVDNFTRNLEIFNDKHLGNSILGKQYRYLKSSIVTEDSSRRKY